MGQKVNPHGLRVGVIKDWDTKWYADKAFADYVVEDVNIRKFIKSKLYACNIPSCYETGYGQNNEVRC